MSKHSARGSHILANVIEEDIVNEIAGHTLLAPFSGSTFSVRIARTMAWAESTRFLFITGRNFCNSAVVKPF